MLKLLLFSLLPCLAFAQTSAISGRVLDKESGEAMIGVTILVDSASNGGVTDKYGHFEVVGLYARQYRLHFTFIGYKVLSATVNLPVADTVDLGDLLLEPSALDMEALDFFANTAQKSDSSASQPDILATEISEQLGAMQLPELLNGTPSVYATIGDGSFGDVRINIRGFDQTEILFMINGVPMNDMESGQMNWGNFVGLNDVTQNMQIQNGLGFSALYANAMGGTVNVATKPFERKRGGLLETGFSNGSWNRVYRLSLHSGMGKRGWAVSLHGSRIAGNGYFQGAYADAWSYFFTATKEINYKHTLILTGLGAAVDRGRVMRASTAQYQQYGSYFHNPAMGKYNGELLNVLQGFSHKPQLTLTHQYEAGERVLIETSLYASLSYTYNTNPVRASGSPAVPITSDGFQDLAYMRAQNTANIQTVNSPNGDTSAVPFSGRQSKYILDARHNNYQWYGLISNMKFAIKAHTTLMAGIDLRSYRANHYATVFDLLGGDFWLDKNGSTDRNILRPNAIARVGDGINYDYDGDIRWGSLFAQIEHKRGRWLSFASANFSRTQMWRTGNYWEGSPLHLDNSFGISEKRTFTNYSAKASVRYRLDLRHSIFANVGTFSRAPYFRNAFQDPRYNNQYLRGLSNENIHAVELGYSHRSSSFRINLNVYYNWWNNRACSYFITDPTTRKRTYFAIASQNTIHRGVEMSFSFDISNVIQLRGMASLGDWYWANNVDHTVSDDFGNTKKLAIVAKGLPIGDVAQNMAFLVLHYKGSENWYAGMRLNYFGRLFEQYDFWEYLATSLADVATRVPVKRLPDYGILDIFGGYFFRISEFRMKAGININNVTNTHSIRRSDRLSNGVTYGLGINFNASLSVFF